VTLPQKTAIFHHDPARLDHIGPAAAKRIFSNTALMGRRFSDKNEAKHQNNSSI